VNQAAVMERGPSRRAPCCCCGGTSFLEQDVLWPELIEAWRLAPAEVEYVNEQQGTVCRGCGANLRSLALARAILDLCGAPGLLRDLPRFAGHLRVLEVNEAGGLTPFLRALPGHQLGRYPQLDMTRMPFRDGAFDLVVHSDTLEHVPDPVAGLAECRRVLRDGGACAFTVPIIVDRLTASRDGLPSSYHNRPGERDPGMVVRTEYGADAWKHVVLAGFRECRLTVLEYPAAIAIAAIR
jgi:SAM-dependent methyltransferase